MALKQDASWRGGIGWWFAMGASWRAMAAALRERSPDQKSLFPGDAASTLRVLPHALPVGSGAVPYGACPRKKAFSLGAAHLTVGLGRDALKQLRYATLERINLLLAASA